MKNYYEILEVDKKASPEVIEKAYKTLVKKYHPDLQNNESQKEYEEKMKDINEAYSVLTDDYKKSIYDKQLQNITISKSEYEVVMQENIELKNELEKIITQIHSTEPQNNYNQNITKNQINSQQRDNTISNMRRVFNEEINRARQQAYNDAYIQDMRNRGYRIKYKHDFKYYIKFVSCTIFIILVFLLIYQIPIVKRFFAELYEENMLFQAIVNILKNTFTTKI